MKKDLWALRFAAILIVATLVLHGLHYLFFRDMHHILMWGLTDLAFLPLDVLVVTLIIDRLLAAREKAQRIEKMNMLVGLFFSEVGTHLLGLFCGWDAEGQALRDQFGSADACQGLDAGKAGKVLESHRFEIRAEGARLEELRKLLTGQRDFLVRLLENPNLLENESFTELLRAVFHLAEELAWRENLADTPETDLRHLRGDVQRAYRLTVREWAAYLCHLRKAYPYLYSLAVRTNPLDPAARATVS